MQVLNHRAASNLDYFGNPAGWAPMLSFEANLAAFENEIDSGIQTLYLTYWLQNKAQNAQKRVAALDYAQTKLGEELNNYIEAYHVAEAEVPGLEARAKEIERRILKARSDLQAIEARLTQQAQQNLAGDQWKRNIKVASAVLNMTPWCAAAVRDRRQGPGSPEFHGFPVGLGYRYRVRRDRDYLRDLEPRYHLIGSRHSPGVGEAAGPKRAAVAKGRAKARAKARARPRRSRRPASPSLS